VQLQIFLEKLKTVVTGTSKSKTAPKTKQLGLAEDNLVPSDSRNFVFTSKPIF